MSDDPALLAAAKALYAAIKRYETDHFSSPEEDNCPGLNGNEGACFCGFTQLKSAMRAMRLILDPQEDLGDDYY